MAEAAAAAAPASKTLLILGASYGGLSCAHYFLRHVQKILPDKDAYNVVLVGESSKFFARPAAPRAVASQKLMTPEQQFYEIAPGFAKYTKEQFTFIQGTATSMDPSTKTVTITSVGGAEQTIEYYALVVATGIRAHSPMLSLHGDYKMVEESQAAFNKALPEAKTILIAGGGPTAVETAGEIAEYVNGTAGFFAAKLANPKVKITLVTSAEKILPNLRPAIASEAQSLLEKRGVEVLYNTKVEAATPDGVGVADSLDAVTQKASVRLSNGETKEVDLYINAMGATPNTSFVPRNLLDERGYVNNNPNTLRVDEAGPFVYAVGDVANYTKGGILDIFGAVPVVMNNMKRDLLAPVGEKPTGKDMPYKSAVAKETHLVPIGRSKGVGAFNGFKLPSLMVYMIKGRDYFASSSPQLIDGSKWNKETKWDQVS